MRALVARYPGLGSLPRAALELAETPLERWCVDGTTLLIKRDDLSAPHLGGNKARALELLLGGLPTGTRVLTVGATGSTHALAVAAHGARLGLAVQVVTWPQEEHEVSRATARRMSALAEVTRARSVVDAYLRAAVRRARGTVHWIPAGGSVALGAIGQAAAALELADQLAREGSRAPEVLVVPLGSGGTAAGLLVGLAIAGLPTRVVGVQVVPRLVASHGRVMRLARGTHALLAQLAREALPTPDPSRFTVDRGAYGGAYGRETPDARAAATALRDAGGPPLEPTYSAKAFAVALQLARRSPHERVLFWLTFDGRWMGATEG